MTLADEIKRLLGERDTLRANLDLAHEAIARLGKAFSADLERLLAERDRLQVACSAAFDDAVGRETESIALRAEVTALRAECATACQCCRGGCQDGCRCNPREDEP